GPRHAAWRFAVVVAVVAALQVHAWIAFLALAFALASLGVRGRPLVCPAAGVAIAAAAAVHAVFFGAGRYQLVLFPMLGVVAALAFAARAGRDGPAGPGDEAPREAAGAAAI